MRGQLRRARTGVLLLGIRRTMSACSERGARRGSPGLLKGFDQEAKRVSLSALAGHPQVNCLDVFCWMLDLANTKNVMVISSRPLGNVDSRWRQCHLPVNSFTLIQCCKTPYNSVLRQAELLSLLTERVVVKSKDPVCGGAAGWERSLRVRGACRAG